MPAASDDSGSTVIKYKVQSAGPHLSQNLHQGLAEVADRFCCMGNHGQQNGQDQEGPAAR
jgi:hypothetical protein